MKLLIAILLSFYSMFAWSDPLSNVEAATKMCSGKKTFSEGYCYGIFDATFDLWSTTHMSQKIKLCNEEEREISTRKVFSWLSNVQEKYSLLLTLRTNENDTTNANKLSMRAIATYNSAQEKGDADVEEVGKKLIVATSEVPNWLEESTPIHFLIMNAFIETHKCK